MKQLFRGFCATLALTMSSSSLAVVLDINFNGTDFLLGSFDSTETGADFYNYNSPNSTSANPIYPVGTPDAGSFIPLTDGAVQFFAHLETDTNILSFGVILDSANDGSGGTFAGSAVVTEPGDPLSAVAFSLSDDPAEASQPSPGANVIFSFSWVACCTDGFVLSGFDPDDIFFDMTVTSGSGLDQVFFLSPNGVNSNQDFDFPEEQFLITVRACDPATDPNQCVIPPVNGVPEPGTIALFGLGLAGLGFARRKKA